MPHLTIEYSANVADVVDIQDLVDAIHAAALATGTAPLDALRTRAVGRDHFAIADQDPANKFVAVIARLGAGRSERTKSDFVQALMNALEDFLGPTQDTMMLSVEYQEIDPATRINSNNVRPLIAERHSTERAEKEI